jgi:HNH endonuclease
MKLLEYWGDIPGFPRYQASYSGKIRHNGKVVQRGRYRFDWAAPKIVCPTIGLKGYKIFSISQYGHTESKYVHILVAMTFIPNPNNYKEVNHKNLIKTDNQVINLEWCTHKQNMEHAARNGVMNKKKKRKTIA